MKRYLMLVLVCSFCADILHAQEMTDVEKIRQFHDDLGFSQSEMREFVTKLSPVMAETHQDIQKRMSERETPSTPQEQVEIMLDGFEAIGTKVKEAAKQHFSRDQYEKLELRFFQMNQGTIDGCLESNEPDVVMGGFGISFLQFAAGQPDFLELTPEQKTVIQQISKETALKTSTALEDTIQAMNENDPEIQNRINALYKELGEAESDSDKERIANEIQALRNEQFKPAMSVIKAVIRDGKQVYWKVLTDAQKAKYEQVMDNIPDYLWAHLPQNATKERPWRPGFGAWVPGMGAPDLDDSPRETRPQRERTGSRFPGSE